MAVHPHLRTAPLPFELRGTPMELLWPSDDDDDDACRFLRAQIVTIADGTQARRRGSGRRRLRAP